MKTIKLNGKWYNLPDGFSLVERINFNTGEREKIIVDNTDNIPAELYDKLVSSDLCGNDRFYLIHPNFKMTKFYLTEKTS